MRCVIFWIFFAVCFAETKKDINYYLEKNHANLWEFYQTIKKQSLEGKYTTFRKRLIIDQKNYTLLNKWQKKKFDGQIVLVVFYKTSKPNYSNFGGVSIDGVLVDDKDEKAPKTYYYKFDGRYYTDLEIVDSKRALYAYCILPHFKHCILLGIPYYY